MVTDKQVIDGVSRAAGVAALKRPVPSDRADSITPLRAGGVS